MAAVNKSAPPSNNELETMMQSFADHQASSEDKCPALLLEAKHQLNVIHSHIHELALEINATEMTLVTQNHMIETTYEMINNTHAWKANEEQKCTKKHQEDLKMYWILKAELSEMHMLANPSYTANYDYSKWAQDNAHEFSAKTHTIVSTSSSTGTSYYTTSSSSTGSTATGGLSAGFSSAGTINGYSDYSSSTTSGFLPTSGYSTTGASGFLPTSGYSTTGANHLAPTLFPTPAPTLAPTPAPTLAPTPAPTQALSWGLAHAGQLCQNSVNLGGGAYGVNLRTPSECGTLAAANGNCNPSYVSVQNKGTCNSCCFCARAGDSCTSRTFNHAYDVWYQAVDGGPTMTASLLQAEAKPTLSVGQRPATGGDSARVSKTRAMVQETKKLALELSSCMAQVGSAHGKSHLSLIEENGTQSPSPSVFLPSTSSGGGLPGQLQGAGASGTTFGTSGLASFGSTTGYLASGASTTGYLASGASSYGGSSTTGYSTSGAPSYSTSGVNTGYTSGYGFGSGPPVVQSGGAYSTTTSGNYHASTGSVYHSSYTAASHSSSTYHSSSHSYLSKYTTSTGTVLTGGTSSGMTSSGTIPGQTAACQYQKHMLQVVYIRAYVEITRLLAQYEVVIHESTCENYIYETEGQQEKVLEGKLVKMTTTVNTFTHKLTAYKLRIEQTFKLEVEMQSHIKVLAQKCGEMEATVSSLDKVRDAIHVMGVCPGLGKLTFVIPKYTGTMMKQEFDSTAQNDAQIDEIMNDLCAKAFPDTSDQNNPHIQYWYRAAETSEIMLRSIEDMPDSNDATVPLMGTCPNCDGNKDEDDGPQHASGYARICWDPDAKLDATNKRSDCSTGKKAIMCVQDRDYANPPTP
jgi:hypothetical protein